jgi:serine/threonine protein kinase
VIDVGAVLDKYELLARVGQGGMAVVYRGIDRSLKREVAVKVLHRHLAEHAEARDRFEREAHAVAKLRHENILEIFAYSGRDSPESYIVTEFIEGATLKQHITDHPPRFAEIGAMVVAEIGRALAHAHGQGILHRDVKPENVMIRSDGVVKLTDFGISQMLDAQRMTVTGQLLGSPAYMSPEHVLGNQLDFRTDVFAAGIVLYQLTVGKLPFEGKNPHEILKRIAECRFVDPRHANPRVGAELGKIIGKAMAADPDARYPTMAAMVSDLEGYLAGSGLGPAKDELVRYFAAPAAYELALGSRLCDHLLRRARAELPTRRAVALELLDRVLTIEPKHEAALALLASATRRARGRQVAAAVAVVAVAGGGGWAVRRALRGSTAPPVVDAAVDAPLDAAIRPDAAPPRSTPRQPMRRSTPQRGPTPRSRSTPPRPSAGPTPARPRSGPTPRPPPPPASC